MKIGIIEKAQYAADETERAKVKERLELAIANLQMEKDKIGQELSNEDIEKSLGELEEVDKDKINTIGGSIDGEYNGEYGFTIDENRQVIVSGKFKGDAPDGGVMNMTKLNGIEVSPEVQLQVTGELKGGTIEKIESLTPERVELDDSEDNTNPAKQTYIVRDNGEYVFRITGSNRKK